MAFQIGFFETKMSYKIDDWDECLQKFKFANKTVKDSFKMKKQIVKAYLYSHAV